jgi:hydroxypyruvate isomerase
MPRFAANLSMMYNEHAFLHRFAAAAKDGFEAVEFLFPYDHPASEVAAALRGAGLKQVLFNAPPGDWAAGEKGVASLPGREREFDEGLDKAIDYAQALECPRIHLMAGLVADESRRAEQRATYVANLRRAAKRLAAYGLTGLIEPIKTRDIPGFLLNTQADAHAVIAEVGEPNLKVQMDLYHCQIVEGDITARLRQWLPTGQVAHLQIAAVPDRGEPDAGELHYPWVFDELQRLGWAGWIGCEYRPRGANTTSGLGWLQAHRRTLTP